MEFDGWRSVSRAPVPARRYSIGARGAKGRRRGTGRRPLLRRLSGRWPGYARIPGGQSELTLAKIPTLLDHPAVILCRGNEALRGVSFPATMRPRAPASEACLDLFEVLV